MSSRDRQPVSGGERLALTLLVGLAALPHLLHLEPVIGLFFGLLWGLALLARRRPSLAPGRLPLLLLTLTGAGMVLAWYPLLFGRAAGSALLTVMAGLKLLEIRRRRDLYVLVYMAFFILVTQFLFFQGIPILLHALAVTLGLTTLLLEASRAAPAPLPWTSLRRAALLLLQAAPLMLVMFLLFPRFSSPLWNLGPQQGAAVSGVSDRLWPGSIGRLALSRAVAFRVEFGGALPSPSRRYWRGRVLWHTDGVEWRPGADGPDPVKPAPAGGTAIAYRVTLEPFPGAWLYSLDLPLAAPDGARLTADLQLLRPGPVKRRTAYRLRSAPEPAPRQLTPGERRRGLQLPDNVTPRMRRLVAGWRRQESDPRRLVARALGHFRDQPFHYTLYPPLLGDNPVDRFLFETRRGFCGHFATAFALLMRLAQIPARIVVGYQGGEVNPLGDYLIVRQSDAHAWVEVWLEGSGWTRVDPTAAVAPQRIERPLNPDLIQASAGAPIDFVRQQPGPLGRWLHRIELGLDAIDTGWRRWVLGYSQQRQGELMRMLGLDFLRGFNLALGMVAAASLLVAALSLALLRHRSGDDALARGYRRYCDRLARIGLPRRPHEGPRDYARRVATARPDLAGRSGAIARLYIALRYGRGAGDRDGLRRFRRLVRAFRPRLRPPRT
ncbi:MAG TPA: DUF3488 domain-containing protein [Sedimenticola thiotaurini]|uniref:DUF3488 domain-containing protein n=1 Tax=Sedimenticola thiotaurini TaxID=1543721 RepID=A0A831W240_9GAMM|nr:DUF3488 domain-containing protein [Sedimenticola thiotaurini]